MSEEQGHIDYPWRSSILVTFPDNSNFLKVTSLIPLGELLGDRFPTFRLLRREGKFGLDIGVDGEDVENASIKSVSLVTEALGMVGLSGLEVECVKVGVRVDEDIYVFDDDEISPMPSKDE